MQELDFTDQEWFGFSPALQVKKCRLLGAEAAKHAVKAPVEMRAVYADLARQWQALAEEIAAVNAQTAQKLSPSQPIFDAR